MPAKKSAVQEPEVVGSSNGGKHVIELTRPYIAKVEVTGTAPIMFHRWNAERVEAQANAPKNSAAKKEDDPESYVYRMPDGRLALQGVGLHNSLREYGRYRQDPRSPRKSMMDLLKAAIVPLNDLEPLIPDRETWDYLDKRRVTIQRSAITRTRPVVDTGWRCRFELLITTPEYLQPTLLLELLNAAGRLQGMYELRPTFGRYQVSGFEVQREVAEDLGAVEIVYS